MTDQTKARDAEIDALLAEEAEFGRRVFAAIDRNEDHDGKMICPTCGNMMDVLRRSRRLTFAGWEPACIQYQCDTCGFGGERVSREAQAEWERLGGYGPLPNRVREVPKTISEP